MALTDETFLTMKSKDVEEKTVTTTIHNVSSTVDNSVLKTYAQMLNSLTTNTFDSLTKVQKETIF